MLKPIAFFTYVTTSFYCLKNPIWTSPKTINSPQKLIFAHRGGTPENTLKAFRQLPKSIVIETDCHLSKDGIVVISHDPHTGRLCDTKV
jgi:glycerophosphoryl diester phosphodiesterase